MRAWGSTVSWRHLTLAAPGRALGDVLQTKLDGVER
jgi:hypothetical protein